MVCQKNTTFFYLKNQNEQLEAENNSRVQNHKTTRSFISYIWDVTWVI